MAISSSDVLTFGPLGHQGQLIFNGALERLWPLHRICLTCCGLSTFAVPQGCDGIQVVAFSIEPQCRHDITHNDRQIGNVSVMYVTLIPRWRYLRHYFLMPEPWTNCWCQDEWMHAVTLYAMSPQLAKSTCQFLLALALKLRDDLTTKISIVQWLLKYYLTLKTVLMATNN